MPPSRPRTRTPTGARVEKARMARRATRRYEGSPSSWDARESAWTAVPCAMPLIQGGVPPPKRNQYSHVVNRPRREAIATSSSSSAPRRSSRPGPPEPVRLAEVGERLDLEPLPRVVLEDQRAAGEGHALPAGRVRAARPVLRVARELEEERRHAAGVEQAGARDRLERLDLRAELDAARTAQIGARAKRIGVRPAPFRALLGGDLPGVVRLVDGLAHGRARQRIARRARPRARTAAAGRSRRAEGDTGRHA